MYIAIAIAVILWVLFLFKDKIILRLLTTKKSKYTLIASYVIKTSKSILVSEDLSIYLSIYLNRYFVSFMEDQENINEYTSFVKAYLIQYYDTSLVDSIDYDSINIENLQGFINSKENSSIEYNNNGEVKYQLILKVLKDLGEDKHVFSKNLSKMSSDLVTIITKYSG